MKPLNIRVAKTHRPLNAEKVMADLQAFFPEYETTPLGPAGQSFIIRQSRFAGARIDVQPKQISLCGKVPDPVARIVDLALLGTVSAARTPKVVDELKRFLRNRYASK